MPKITIVDAETNEIIEREMNDEEILQLEKDQENYDLLVAEQKATELKRAALLGKLGITDEEVRLLFS
jgi:hypothetical protein